MQFSSLAEFFIMDGHGFYVWFSYGTTVLLFVLLGLFSKIRHKATIKHIQQQQKRQLKLKQAALLQEQE